MNLNQLDHLEYDGSEKALATLEIYIDELLEHFLESTEGIEYAKEDPDAGFWVAKLVDYSFIYEGVSLPTMEAFDVEEILTDVFPRKISLGSPDEAHAVIPELLAFWHFMKREHNLKEADSILLYLQETKDGYYEIMNDASNFGPAKSFVSMGQKSGFDMSDGDDINAFMQSYNQNTLGNALMGNDLPFDELGRMDTGSGARTATVSKKEQAKKKKIQKMKKASKKKNNKNKNKKKKR